MASNLSHSLGVVIAALVVLIPSVRDLPAALGDPAWVAFVACVPAIYLGISVRYWFDQPTTGIAVGTGLFYAGLGWGLLLA